MLNNSVVWDDITPFTFQLSQNYPNPFKDRTTIKYCIAYKTKVKLKVYDEEHKEIETLVDEEKNPGTYEVEFNDVGTHRDASLQNEIYYYQLKAGDYKCEKKMELIK
ncbi:MAG: hypothetical protein R6W68_16245 [Ignavibacteriaceae bacterium]